MAGEREPLARLDELFDAPVEPETQAVAAPPASRPRLAARLLWPALVAALCAGAVYVVLLPLGYRVAYPLLFAAFYGLIALRGAVLAVRPARVRVGAAPPPPATAPDDQPDGLGQAVGRWERRLRSGARDERVFGAQVRPRLTEIVDERLRQRHGVTRTGDPGRARQILGERLWTLLTASPARTRTAGELATIVDEMEKL